MVRNDGGGFRFRVDRWPPLRRFLVMGAFDTDRVGDPRRGLVHENMKVLDDGLRADYEKTIDEIAQISDAGRAPSNDPALYCLAYCASWSLADQQRTIEKIKNGMARTRTAKDRKEARAALKALSHKASPHQIKVRRYALRKLRTVARIGTHLFHFLEYAKAFRGDGRGLTDAVADGYTAPKTEDVIYQVLKYRQRDGWSHKDALRIAHPKTADSTRNPVVHGIAKGWPSVGEQPHPDPTLARIGAFERLQQARTEEEVVDLLKTDRLPIECVPTEKQSREVYRTVMHHAGLEWTLRNLGNLTKKGLLDPGCWDENDRVIARLTDPEQIQRARIHPLKVLLATGVYGQGHGDKGGGTWTPEPKVLAALEQTFMAAFGNVAPTGKRFMVAVDVSGSMSWPTSRIPHTNLYAKDVAGALAMVTDRTEPHAAIGTFSGDFEVGSLQPGWSLAHVVRYMEQRAHRATHTDGALPMLWAAHNRVAVDGFVIDTDNDTNSARSVHPSVALDPSRWKMGLPARLVVGDKASHGFPLARPGRGLEARRHGVGDKNAGASPCRRLVHRSRKAAGPAAVHPSSSSVVHCRPRTMLCTCDLEMPNRAARTRQEAPARERARIRRTSSAVSRARALFPPRRSGPLAVLAAGVTRRRLASRLSARSRLIWSSTSPAGMGPWASIQTMRCARTVLWTPCQARVCNR